MTRAPKSRAVVERRHVAPSGLDFFPTPPWATRALVEVVLPKLGLSLEGASVWEPAAGEGHMASVLDEYALGSLFASDVFAYPSDHAGRRSHLNAVGSFVGEGPDVVPARRGIDWVITNPPFKLAEEFVLRGLDVAECVAILIRTAFIEGGGRYDRLFGPHRPLAVAQFAERVPMHEGRWEPDGSTATAYAWIVWQANASVETRLLWIPPGQRERLERPTDRAIYGAKAPAPFDYKSGEDRP